MHKEIGVLRDYPWTLAFLFKVSNLLNQRSCFFYVSMGRQWLLIHVIRVCPADLQLNYKVDEYRLFDLKIIFFL